MPNATADNARKMTSKEITNKPSEFETGIMIVERC